MSSWAEDRVRRKRILDRFCGPRMTYEFIGDFRYDANLFNESNNFVGIAKIFSKPGNFGNSPIVEISKEDLDFLYELGLLTHKKPAVIVKFRNKLAYIRLDNLDFKTSKGKRSEEYRIPIGDFKICGFGE